MFQDILADKSFKIDEQNIKTILVFYVRLLELNFQRAELDGCNAVRCHSSESFSAEKEYDIYDAREWVSTTYKLYQSLPDDLKIKLVGELQKNIRINGESILATYCKNCIYSIIRKEIDCIFEGERSQNDFLHVFGELMSEYYVNDLCADILKDKLIDYNQYHAVEIIQRLDKSNCTYLFSYLIIYYSICRFNWKFININVLLALWCQHGNIQDDREKVIEQITKSNINHKFDEKMYTKLAEYISKRMDENLFDTIKSDELLDVFYIWVIKTCVTSREQFDDYVYNDSIGLDDQIMIVNELSKHDELLGDKNIQKWVCYMRYNIHTKLIELPEKLNITIRSLLLMDVNYNIIIDYVSSKNYLHKEVLGAYLLVKCQELSADQRQNMVVKEAIKTAFIASKLNVEEYINWLETECTVCVCDLNYVQKEAMKSYLLETF